MIPNLAHKYTMYILTIILQLADHALSGQPDITIPNSSSQLLVPAGSNKEKICLKQVSILPLGRFHHPFAFNGHPNHISLSGTRISGQ